MSRNGRAVLARRELEIRAVSFPPKPAMNAAEWAERYLVLSGKASAEPGYLRLSRTPYLREVLEVASHPGKVILWWGSQLGKTTGLLALTGYYLSEESAPVLFVMPTLDMARSLSTDRLAPLFALSPRFKGRVRDSGRRDPNNTMLHKSVTGGGYVALVGANSPASLASRPIRVVLADEVDRYAPSAGRGEGDVVALAEQRTAAWWNALMVLASTPGVKGTSRLAAAYEDSDQREYEIPCPSCGDFQVLAWERVIWEPDRPETASVACASCGDLIPERAKATMLAQGRWVARQPGRAVKGFKVNGLYSPFVPWAERVRHFLTAKSYPEQLRVFVNAVLAELWDPDREGESVSVGLLHARREPYPATVPNGVGLLTAAVDVQGDRLEVLVMGWGAGEECWPVAFEQLWGDPTGPAVWRDLDVFRARGFAHEAGGELKIHTTVVDAAFASQSVYDYVQKRRGRLFAIRGVPGDGRALIGRPTRPSEHGARLFPVGVHAAKEQVLARLKLTMPGPGYTHIPMWADDELLEQFTAEKIVLRHSKGQPVRQFVKIRQRNEGLDLLAYNVAALVLAGPQRARLAALAQQVGGGKVVPPPEPPAPSLATVKAREMLRKTRGGVKRKWVDSW
jgi:phage terminase large subunit GpA-like protein